MKGINNKWLSFDIFNIVSLGDCLYGLPAKGITPPCHCGILPVDIHITKKMSCVES